MDTTASDIIAFASVGVAIATVIALTLQLRQSTRIARRASNLNFLSEIDSNRIESELDAALMEVGIGSTAERRGTPFSSEEVATILADPKTCGAMNMMVNHLENIAIAEEFQLVDREIWKRVHRSRLVWWAQMVREYIIQARRAYSDDGMWAGVYGHCSPDEQHGE